MGNLNITVLLRVIAYASVCSAYLYKAFLTYEGLTRNVRVTYAERMPGVLGASTKFIDFLASHIILYEIYQTSLLVQKPIGQKNNFVPPPPLKRLDGCMFTVIQWANFLACVSSLNVDTSY